MHYYVVGKGGNVKLDMDVTLPDPVMMHDFAITEDYAVFMDFPLTFNGKVSGFQTAAVPFIQWPSHECLSAGGCHACEPNTLGNSPCKMLFCGSVS